MYAITLHAPERETPIQRRTGPGCSSEILNKKRSNKTLFLAWLGISFTLKR